MITFNHAEMSNLEIVKLLRMIFYELLTGKLPYEGYSIAEITAKIVNPDIKPVLNASRLSRIVLKCLEKKKDLIRLKNFLNP